LKGVEGIMKEKWQSQQKKIEKVIGF
jgi:hypothetical protein